MEIAIILVLVFIILIINKIDNIRFSRLESRVSELERTIEILNKMKCI